MKRVSWIARLLPVFTASSHAAAGTLDGRRPPARIIGQGAILYQGGHWFFRGADGLRTADDLGRFRLQYALGWPLFGIHGSYILVSGADNQRLSFDVGPANSLTEDAAWASTCLGCSAIASAG